MTCRARRVNDQYHCHACGVQWDIDDEDRPMCKPGNRVGLGIVLMLVASVASADLACDASVAGALTTSTLRYAEACAVTVDHVGYAVGGQSAECQLTRTEAIRQYAAVLDLSTRGCTTYYAGPSRQELKRLRELGDKFATAR